MKSEKLATAFLLLTIVCCSFTKADDIKALREWTPAAVVSDDAVKAYSLDSCFMAFPISDAIFLRMQGKSYKQNCTVPRTSLRYLRVLHRNVEGKTQLGEIVCNQTIADDLLDIFRQLYEAGYRIERITLIDDYDADDERSMTANNTSSFNFRVVAGSITLSKHARGLAIDINPLYNPCLHLRTGKVEPYAGKPYATNRNGIKKAKVALIDKNDLCYQLFVKHGFHWGGDWRNTKDYQHFEK